MRSLPVARQLPTALDAAVTRLHGAGLDLVQAFALARYNRVVAAPLRLADFGRSDALAMVIGNTRALWPHFCAALRESPRLREASDPLDTYVEETVGAALEGIDTAHTLRWAHEQGARRVAIQRAAEVSGLAILAPSMLCVHPQYGPWIALRALVAFDCSAEMPPRSEPHPLCKACQYACVPAFRHAGAGGGGWRAWLAVRDACPLGLEHRYGADQIEYHYTKRRDVLHRVVCDWEGS